MPEITFQVEPYGAAIDGMKALYAEHWEEVERDKDKIPLDPNFAAYEQMAENGLLHVVTVRADGVVVGYYMAVVMPALASKDSLTAYTDVFFLKKEYRHGTGAGYRLLRLMVNTLRARGVKRIYMGTKLGPEHDIGCLLERLGFNPIERIYTLVLPENA